MFKLVKIKSVMMLMAVAIVGVVSLKSFPMFYSEYTVNKKLQDSSVKEDYKNDVAGNSLNTSKNVVDEVSEVSSDEKKSSDNSQSDNDINKQETIYSSSEKSDKNTNVQTVIPYEKDIDSNDKVEQTTTDSQVKDAEKKSDASVVPETKIPKIQYDRTTSIYADDKITLLRVEYYINNKLVYYSDVGQFDAETESYVEKIYQYNYETDMESLVRTDIYVNGKLTKSY